MQLKLQSIEDADVILDWCLSEYPTCEFSISRQQSTGYGNDKINIFSLVYDSVSLDTPFPSKLFRNAPFPFKYFLAGLTKSAFYTEDLFLEQSELSYTLNPLEGWGKQTERYRIFRTRKLLGCSA